MSTDSLPVPSPIRRILLALDASPASRAAIRTAVDLATHFDARITGLFVEDINLLRVSRLPFVREIDPFSPIPRALNPHALQRQLQLQADQLRRALALAAEVRGLEWAFRVTSGPVALELLTAGTDSDLLIMGRSGTSPAAGGRMGSTVRSILMQRAGLTFILETAMQFPTPVTVLYDGSEAGARGLEIAASLVAEHQRHLSVIMVAETEAEARSMRPDVIRLMAGTGCEVRALLRPSHAGLAWLVRATGPGPVVLPCGRERLQGEKLCALVDSIPNQVLLVR